MAERTRPRKPREPGGLGVTPQGAGLSGRNSGAANLSSGSSTEPDVSLMPGHCAVSTGVHGQAEPPGVGRGTTLIPAVEPRLFTRVPQYKPRPTIPRINRLLIPPPIRSRCHSLHD